MGRPRSKKAGESLNLSFRADPELVAAIDAEVERRNKETPGLNLSRTQTVMVLLWEGLRAARGKK